MDASIVCCHMMLEAWELGLGSCWVRLFSVADVQRAFVLPGHIVPRCMLPVGYAHPSGGPYRPWHDGAGPWASWRRCCDGRRPTDLTDVPGIGTKKAALLASVGCPDLASLRGADADDLYARAQLHEGRRLDKCVPYAFRRAIAYAEGPHPNACDYRWWHFCDNGKDRKADER